MFILINSILGGSIQQKFGPIPKTKKTGTNYPEDLHLSNIWRLQIFYNCQRIIQQKELVIS